MSTEVKAILAAVGNPKSKVFRGTGEDGSQYEATLFWYNNAWRIIDYLEPIALKLKKESILV